MKGILIRPNDLPVLIDQDWDLDALQAAVGGWIEGFATGFDGTAVYGNEEGKILGLPLNPVVDELMRAQGVVGPGDFIVGPVVFLGIDDEGENTDVPTEVAEFLLGRPA